MQTQLVMVEGIPFTGKSTLSEFLAQQLALNGHAARWVSEGEMLRRFFPHVLATFDQGEPLSEAELRANWSAFVEAIAGTPEIFVVDSALSYAALHPRLEVDRPTESILSALEWVAALCEPLQPRVLHLTGDVERLVRDSLVERGEGWERHLVGQSDASTYQQARGRTGVEGVILMLAEAQALMQRSLERGWRALTLDVTGGNRRENQRAALDFLGIPEVVVEPPALTPETLRSYTGTYVADDPERAGRPLIVRQEPEGLVLYGSDERYDLLVPLTETRFHLRASPVDLEFVEEEEQGRHLVLFASDGKEYLYRRS